MSRPHVLVAGVGDVFLGDDAFGVAVVERLRTRALHPAVCVVDFGICGLDLWLALERCEAAVVVDAVARGGAPGTLYVIEPDLGGAEEALPSPHGMTLDEVLRRLSPGARPRTVRIVGCEPESLGGGALEGLSAPVRAAVDEAVPVVEALVREILGGGADA